MIIIPQPLQIEREQSRLFVILSLTVGKDSGHPATSTVLKKYDAPSELADLPPPKAFESLTSGG